MPDSNQVPNGAENAQNPPITLTAEQAETLLRADLRNLVRKIHRGRLLTAGERNLLQSTLNGGRASTENFVSNQVELAEILGVDRKTIQRHRKIEGNPGVRPDGRWDVNAWRLWMAERRGIDEGEGMSQTQLKARQLLLQNERLAFQIDILKRQHIPVEDVEKMGGDLMAAIRKVVSQIHLVAPSVVGLSVPEAEVRLKESEDEILEQLRTLPDRLAEWHDAPAA